MVEHIKMKNRDWKTLRGMDNEMVDWMKYHSIQDLRDLAFEMYNMGEDISEMVQLIHDMDGMARKAHLTREENVYENSEYDILSYVEECERVHV